MYNVHADPGKNRLYLTLSGYMALPEIQEAAAALDREVHKLRPGFSVIHDVSTFRPANDEGADVIAAAQKAVAARGMRMVVRVITAESARLPMERSSQEAWYKALVAEDRTEADRLLDAAG
jgi:MFS superfamily sulfate permease-like transporter